MIRHLARPEHEISYLDLCQLLNRHEGRLSPLELLAVAANMVGKLVALQDQRTVTPAMAMEVVARNIEHGNKELVDRLAQSEGRA
jgi:hypothetical protein